MDFTPFVDLIAKYGLWVVFAGLWFLERTERKELQAERKDVTERYYTGSQAVTEALKELRYAIRGERRD